MKNINEYINENLITEANGQLVVFFDHESPENTYVVTGADNKLVNKISDFNFDVQTIPYTKNIVDIVHSDEWGYLNDTKCKAESQLKSKILASIKKSQNAPEDRFSGIDFDPISMYEEFDDMSVEEIKEKKPEFFYKWLVDLYSDSYIDGDSSSARVVYNPEKKQVVFGGGMNIICYTAEEYEKVLKEWKED